MRLVVPFDQADAGFTSLVGGKGHNLIWLTEAGFPVPPGFVVKAECHLAPRLPLAPQADKNVCPTHES